MWVNVEGAIKDLEQLTKQLTGKQLANGVSRGINKAIMKGRTAARAEVKSVYNIPQKNVAGININKSFPTTLRGEIFASAKPIPMDAFAPKFETRSQSVTVSRKGVQKVKDRKRKSKAVGGGVSIEVIKGSREVVPYAFMLVNNKPRVFARGAYKSGAFGFKQRHTRLNNSNNNDSVKPLVSITVHAAVINPGVIGKLSTKIISEYPGLLKHEIEFLLSKIKTVS